MINLSAEQSRAAADEVDFWWHNIDFGHGVVTNGHNPKLAQEILSKCLPVRLENNTVLDVGCWDGRYSFEAEARGAKEITAIDSGQQKDFVRSRYGLDIDPFKGIRTAKAMLGSNVNFYPVGLSEIAASGQQYDISYYLGVLYHQENPTQSLRELKRVTRKTAFIESEILRWPIHKSAHAYHDADQLNNDPTNWYVPSIPRLFEWIYDAGFQKAKLRAHYTWLGRRAVVQAWS